MAFSPNAETVYADGPFGSPLQPAKSEIRALLAQYENVISAFTTNGGLIFTLKSNMDSVLTHGPATMAWVIGDPVVGNNGVYQKLGVSGTGSWVRRADLPYSFIIASDAGAGTPNAIQATTSIPVSSSALVMMGVFESNTASPVTVSFNGGSALTIKTNTGSNIVAGGLTAGMIVLGVVSGSTFRLVSDQVSAAIVAAAEAAQAAAQAAQAAAETAASDAEVAKAAAEAAAAGVSLPPVAANRMLVDNAAGTARESKTFAEVRKLLRVAEQLTPEMYDVPTDGVTPAYVALQALFTAAEGKIVIMPREVTFDIGSSVLSIKEGTTVFWNGCTVRRSAAANNYAIEIDGADVTFVGALYHTSAGDRGLRIRHSNFSCEDGVWITADAAGTGGGDILRDAVRIDTNGAAYPKNVRGRFYITNFDMGLCSKGCEELFAYVKARTYRTAVWLRDTTHAEIRGSAKIGSPNNLGKPGENGILIESVAADYSSRDIQIVGFVVEDSGEHANRVGGQKIVADVWFTRCRTKNTGAADGTGVEPDDHGGCGFKVLGPTSVLGAYHQNIHFIDCVVEDIHMVDFTTDQNFAGFDIGKVIGCTVVNPIVRRSDPSDGAAFSCLNGIEIYGSQYVQVTNPLIDKPYQDGIFFFENASTAEVFWGQQNWYHTVVGGRVFSPGKAGVHVRPVNLTFRRISIQGLEVEGGERGLHYEVTGTGGQVLCSAELTCWNQTVETVTGTSTWPLKMSGTFQGANAAKNGSTFNDDTNAVFKHRKAGAWVSL
ncbi:hypothetical protein [Sinorhizobium meliloti]|uniref:hypothetical protein n=1 Tax=Rhizobium meliloti TaxID=382 RepID=UPI000FD4B4D3|nr:hypothetical protein [Sinorhizobium meliloti]RVH07868.1 hypothetical protein CN217_20905 [Sinorhizobium meliloti]RVO10988.1 hypothetical protein CN102_04900 [Sinorhizobium meliloti]